jgi:hypothetical protein
MTDPAEFRHGMARRLALPVHMAVADDEQKLRIEQMQADIDNKRMDTMYKHGLLRFEPWKIAFTAFGAGAAALAAVIAALNYFHH